MQSLITKRFYFKQFNLPQVRSGAATPGQSKPGSDSKQGVLHIPLSYRISGASS